jgi:hypothetical protein
MIAVKTQHDLMLDAIMEFTGAVVVIAQMPGIHVKEKAEAIFLAEKVLHKIIMDKIVERCEKTSTPCQN